MPATKAHPWRVIQIKPRPKEGRFELECVEDGVEKSYYRKTRRAIENLADRKRRDYEDILSGKKATPLQLLGREAQRWLRRLEAPNKFNTTGLRKFLKQVATFADEEPPLNEESLAKGMQIAINSLLAQGNGAAAGRLIVDTWKNGPRAAIRAPLPPEPDEASHPEPDEPDGTEAPCTEEERQRLEELLRIQQDHALPLETQS